MGRNGYDIYLENHKKIFGETPEIKLIGQTHEHLDLWDTKNCEINIAKIFGNNEDFAIYNSHTNKWYEARAVWNGNELWEIQDNSHYEKWHAPMPYWIYSRG